MQTSEKNSESVFSDLSPCSIGKAWATDIANLEKGLEFIEDQYIHELSIALIQYLDTAQVSVADLQYTLGDKEAQEVLLLGFDWRLILPFTSGSMAWEDSNPSLDSRASLKVPQVVRLLVQKARKSGFWRPALVLPETSPLLPRDTEIAAKLLEYIFEYAPGHMIGANELGAAFWEAGMDLNLDALIAHWKGAGVISPRMSSLSSVAARRSPVYELHPAVFVARGE